MIQNYENLFILIMILINEIVDIDRAIRSGKKYNH